MTDNKSNTSGWAEVDPEAGVVKVTDEAKLELKKKNYVVAAALLAFVALVFFVSIAKLSQNFGA